MICCREIADAAVGLKAQDTETNRIIELSKRNRALNLMLEREKQKAAGLAAELQKVQLLDGVPAAGTDPKVGVLHAVSWCYSVAFCW